MYTPDRNYLTFDEYQYFGGTLVLTEAQMHMFNLQFESLIHPNQWLLSEFYKTHGSYPIEIKFAIMEFIRFSVENDSQLNGLPIGGSVVGSTSIDYVNSVADNFGLNRYRIPPKMKDMMKPTNILSPRAWKGFCSGIVLVGTPFVLPPTPTVPDPNAPNPNDMTMSNVEGTEQRLHSVEELLTLQPSIKMKVFARERIMDGSIVSQDFHVKELGIVNGWYRGTDYREDKRATLIIEPKYNNGDLVVIQREYVFEFEIDSIKHTLSVDSFDQHLDFGGKQHHLMIYGT